MTVERPYSLGTSTEELARLDAQAASVAMPTSMFLRSAGIAPGMRVLDLGTGLGHVAFMLSEIVGPSGWVVAIDQSAAMVNAADQRRAAAGVSNVQFVEADVRSFAHEDAFDAVVGRLILFHLRDPVEVLRHHVEALTDGGIMLMIDFDVGSARSEPPVPAYDTARDWVIEGFRRAGASPMIGSKLTLILSDAGLADVNTFGVQSYVPPGDPTAPALLAGVVHSLARVIVANGIASEDQVEPASLQVKLAEALHASRAVALLPGVAGAWGRRPAGASVAPANAGA